MPMIEPGCRRRALTKLAFFGYAGVTGSPSFSSPPPTVGQAMNAIGSSVWMPGEERRKALEAIVSTGRNVNEPARSLLGAGIGAFAGNMVSKALGLGDFSRGMATAIGAGYGYRSWN